ncbi:MAG: hypothetical protein ACRDNT_07880 [Streptosporangiaceae bacterium]
MGLISKQIHQRATNRLAQPTRAVTRLDVDQTLDALRGLIEQTPSKAGLLHSGEKLWLAGQAPGPWSVYYGPPSRKDPSKVVPTWTTHVTLNASSTGTETLVTISLAKWKTRDGKLVGRREFEQFLADMAAQIAARDPSYSALDAS